MEIPFTKMHGLGNSYIYVDLFKFDIEEQHLSKIAMDVADRNTGIGSDGLILIHPSDKASVGMRIFNLDGSEGKNCGNGLRCVAKYAFENKLVEATTFNMETKGGIVEATVHLAGGLVDEVTVDMGNPILERERIPMTGAPKDTVVAESFEVNHHRMEITAVSMGNPHAVFFVDRIDEAPLHELGPVITKDQRFPEEVNVEFIEVVSDKELHFRVWERGSGITQACGTGACAAVVASVLNGYARRDEEVCVHLSGGDLYITWEKNGNVKMRGKAETTASGTYYWKPKR